MHDSILLYAKKGVRRHTFNVRYEPASQSYMERFGGKTQRLDVKITDMLGDEVLVALPLEA